MKFRKLDPSERAALAKARAQPWRGGLSDEEFAERNLCLYAHPFGQSRMHTFGLEENGTFPASLDAVEVTLLCTDGKGQVTEEKAFHLASVLTLAQARGRGLATQLIRNYFETQTPKWSTLFSGIGPRFYERFGFRATLAYQALALSERATRLGQSCELSLTEFVALQRADRTRSLKSRPEPGVCFAADALWWDWCAEIYGYFAKARGKTVPRGRFWQLETSQGSVGIAALENAVTDCLDVWWAGSYQPEVMEWLSDQAARLKMPRVRWWTPVRTPQTEKEQVAMVRSPAGLEAPLLDPQLGDWW